MEVWVPAESAAVGVTVGGVCAEGHHSDEVLHTPGRSRRRCGRDAAGRRGFDRAVDRGRAWAGRDPLAGPSGPTSPGPSGRLRSRSPASHAARPRVGRGARLWRPGCRGAQPPKRSRGLGPASFTSEVRRHDPPSRSFHAEDPRPPQHHAHRQPTSPTTTACPSPPSPAPSSTSPRPSPHTASNASSTERNTSASSTHTPSMRSSPEPPAATRKPSAKRSKRSRPTTPTSPARHSRSGSSP